MPRIRTIDPYFPRTPSLSRVSREARLFFVLLWTVADDSGRLRLNHERLIDRLYPFDSDALSLLPLWLGELEAARCIELYRVEDVEYLRVRKWRQMQAIDRPTQSRLPRSPIETIREAREPREESPRMQKERASKANPREDFNAESPDDTGDAGKAAVLRDLRRIQEQAEADGSHAAAIRSVELRGRHMGLWRGQATAGKEPANDEERSLSPAELMGMPVQRPVK